MTWLGVALSWLLAIGAVSIMVYVIKSTLR